MEQIPWMYDALCALLERTGLARWRDWLTRGARGRTLELGCGTGRNLPRYALGEPVIALEPDEAALRVARLRAPGALLVRGSAEALPFRDGAFDTVVASLVFCTVPRPEVGLAEVRRVLDDGGQLRMLEHVRSEGWVGPVQDALQPAWTVIAGGCHPNRSTEATVAAAGFVLEEEGRRRSGSMRRFSARKR